jgi:hypothetical protein
LLQLLQLMLMLMLMLLLLPPLLLLQVGCQRNGGWYQDYSLVGGHHR